jgi:hypothetical protein
MHLIYLAVAIYRLPASNQFKPYAITIFNRRFAEFQHPLYLLSYFCHPLYRGKHILFIK